MPLLPQRLREILVQSGCLSLRDFDFAHEQAEKAGKTVEEAIVDSGLMPDKLLGQNIARAVGFAFVDLSHISIPRELAQMVSPAVAKSNQVVVFGRSLDGRFRLATHMLENYDFIRKFEKKFNGQTEIYYATPHSINSCIDKGSGPLREEIGEVLQKFTKATESREENASEMVDFIIQRAYHAMASDVHLNPNKNSVLVRFRIDGIIYSIGSYPFKIHNRIVNRIKVLAQLRIDEQKSFQDGRFDFHSEYDERVNVRVSTIPVICGENIVMRFLTERNQCRTLTNTGLNRRSLSVVHRNLKKSHGMILCVGPSGAGKTTTIYAMLQVLNNPDVNITTIEDPIEYSVDGIQQVQVDPIKGITFASGLRSLVRQDPDIIVVGEIRDQETANIAVNSSMAGHLVLSSMHANDAATVFPRFMEMGVEPFLLASSANLVISQRLLRRICHVCRESHYPTKKEMALIKSDRLMAQMIREITGLTDLKKIRIYQGRGCRACQGSGYVGRVGIFELLEVDEEMRSMMTSRASSRAIRHYALKAGMVELIKDGLGKVLMGQTTLEELIREINLY